MATEARFDAILGVLARHGVEHVVVGGVAAILQGSPLTTEDLDVVYDCTQENLARLERALKELRAFYLDPAGGRIEPDAERLASGRVHLLKTECGRLDALRTVGNDLAFEDLVEESSVFEIEDLRVRVLALEAIIVTKEHANRPKDQYQLPFLRQLREEIRSRERG